MLTESELGSFSLKEHCATRFTDNFGMIRDAFHTLEKLEPESLYINWHNRKTNPQQHWIFRAKWSIRTRPYSVPLWVCLSVVFSEIAALLCSSAVSWSVYVHRFWIKFAECTKCFRYDPKVVSEAWSTRSSCENEPSSDSVQIVGECSSVALEENPVKDSLAVFLVHNQSCTMKSTVEFEMN